MGHYFFITNESDHYLGHYQPLLSRWWVLVMITKVMITLLVGTKKKWSSYKCISVAWMKSDGDHFVMAVMITFEVILPSLRKTFALSVSVQWFNQMIKFSFLFCSFRKWSFDEYEWTFFEASIAISLHSWYVTFLPLS